MKNNLGKQGTRPVRCVSPPALPVAATKPRDLLALMLLLLLVFSAPVRGGDLQPVKPDKAIIQRLPDARSPADFNEPMKTYTATENTGGKKVAEKTFPDGSVETVWEDGTVSNRLPDGTSIQFHPDGTKSVVPPEPKDSTGNKQKVQQPSRSVYDNENDKTVEKLPDGRTVTTYHMAPGEQDIVHMTFPDGHAETTWADGSKSYNYPDVTRTDIGLAGLPNIPQDDFPSQEPVMTVDDAETYAKPPSFPVVPGKKPDEEGLFLDENGQYKVVHSYNEAGFPVIHEETLKQIEAAGLYIDMEESHSGIVVKEKAVGSISYFSPLDFKTKPLTPPPSDRPKEPIDAGPQPEKNMSDANQNRQPSKTWQEVKKGNVQVNITDRKTQERVPTKKIVFIPEGPPPTAQETDNDKNRPVPPPGTETDISKEEKPGTTGPPTTDPPWDLPYVTKADENGKVDTPPDLYQELYGQPVRTLVQTVCHGNVEQEATLGWGVSFEETLPKKPKQVAVKKDITGTKAADDLKDHFADTAEGNSDKAAKDFEEALDTLIRVFRFGNDIARQYGVSFSNIIEEMDSYLFMHKQSKNDLGNSNYLSFQGDNTYLINSFNATGQGWDSGEIPPGAPTCADDIPGMSTKGSKPGEWIEYDIPEKAQAPEFRNGPNDPLYHSRGSWGQVYDDQWALKKVGFSSLSQADFLWGNTKDLAPVTVAVIDSGLDLTHPELENALWKNEKEIPGNGTDDDGNGFVDDVHGWNFVGDNNNVTDDNGHGTVTAGIIAAAVNNARGICGVNPAARIMPVKVLDFVGEGGSIKTMNGIFYAVNNGARVINISIGGKTLSLAEQEAVDYAQRKGVVVVVAAGNEGIDLSDYTPGGLKNVITVASTDDENNRTTFSNWGQAVDIAAPGVDIISLRAKFTDLLAVSGPPDYTRGKAVVGRDGKYYRVTGSSFSAPFVAGVASLILSQNPKLTGEEVKRMVLNSADDIDHPGWDQFTGYGLLNAKRALSADPGYYTRVQISDFKMEKEKGKTVVNVYGTVQSSHFKKAYLEIGFGDDAEKFKKVGKAIKKEVTEGVLGSIPSAMLKQKGRYCVRLVLETHKDESKEARGSLDID